MYTLANCLRQNLTTKSKCGDKSFARIGRFYEEKCQDVISKLFEVPVKLVGGANDGGVDLIWTKPLRKASSPVEKEDVIFIGQCKHVRKAISPGVVRGLEGTLSKWPTGTVGCLITNNFPSLGLLNLINESKYPLMFFTISGCDASCKVANLIRFNHKFTELYPDVQVVPVRGSKPPQYILRFD